MSTLDGHPLQGSIYWANLNPGQGSKQAGMRPVVVVSGNTMNAHLPVCIVCPLSTQIKNYHTCVQLMKNKTNRVVEDSEVLTFQVRTISSARLERKLGTISPTELKAIIQKIGNLLLY